MIEKTEVKVLYLHHSTGGNVWRGGIEKYIEEYNASHDRKIAISERAFPNAEPYGWNNYPFDYYNIWVVHAGEQPFMGEDTLEIMSKEYDVIVFKHCFPVSSIVADEEVESSQTKTLANYKSQYQALKNKLNSFTDVKFLIWTGAAQVKNNTCEDDAKRARNFFDWVKDEWDIDGHVVSKYNTYNQAEFSKMHRLE